MTNGLRVLEQSLKKPGVNTSQRTNKMKSSARSLTAARDLREQIDIVQGRRVGQPSNSLRALEDYIAGRNSPAQQKQKEALRETQRLDFGQAPAAAAPNPIVSSPANPSPIIPSPTTTVAAENIPKNLLTPDEQNIPVQQAIAATQSGQSYSPEFSAPNTGRFNVEPFSDNSEINAVMPSTTAPSHSTAPLSPGSNTNAQREFPVFEEDDWRQQGTPQKISSSSRSALNGSAALAKEDFERDLAAILGTSANTADPTSTNDNFAPPTERETPTSTQNKDKTETQAPPHPTHDIFDQMGKSLRYANSFDLGAVNLRERFDQFDRDLGMDEASTRAQKLKKKDQAQPGRPSLFVDPYAKSADLDEFDLMAELAEIGDEYPELAKAKCRSSATSPANGSSHTPSATNEQNTTLVGTQNPTQTRATTPVTTTPVPSSTTPATADEQIGDQNHTQAPNQRIQETQTTINKPINETDETQYEEHPPSAAPTQTAMKTSKGDDHE